MAAGGCALRFQGRHVEQREMLFELWQCCLLSIITAQVGAHHQALGRVLLRFGPQSNDQKYLR